MTRKQERKLLARRIRKATGVPLPVAVTLAKHVLWGSLYWLTRTQPPRQGETQFHYGRSESIALCYVDFCHWNCGCSRCQDGPVSITGPRGSFTPLYDSPEQVGAHSKPHKRKWETAHFPTPKQKEPVVNPDLFSDRILTESWAGDYLYAEIHDECIRVEVHDQLLGALHAALHAYDACADHQFSAKPRKQAVDSVAELGIEIGEDPYGIFDED